MATGDATAAAPTTVGEVDLTPPPSVQEEAAGDTDTWRIFVASDNHAGFLERDAVRGHDSFASFEEVFQQARRHAADFVLLGGDIFHDQKPSRTCMFRVIQTLRTHSMTAQPVRFQCVNKELSQLGGGRFSSHLTFEDPHLESGMPVFSIHGNHDDPSRNMQGESVGALDVLSAAGLVNYFGKTDTVDELQVEPLLLRKGKANLALYGIGSMPDARLLHLFRKNKVRFLRPDDEEAWFSILVIHQNRDNKGRGVNSCIPDEVLPEFLDIVIWGHEHESLIHPTKPANKSFFLVQPGSTVATSLVEAESHAKHGGLLRINHNRQFKMQPVRLRCVRPFLMRSIVLSSVPELHDARSEHDLPARVEAFIISVVDEMLAAAADQLAESPEEERPPTFLQLPIIKVRIDTSGFPSLSLNAARLNGKYVGRLANDRDVVQIAKVRRLGAAAARQAALEEHGRLRKMWEHYDKPGGAGAAVESHLTELLFDSEAKKHMMLLPAPSMVDAVSKYVADGEAQDTKALEDAVERAMKKVRRKVIKTKELPAHADDIEKAIEGISRHRQQKELQRQARRSRDQGADPHAGGDPGDDEAAAGGGGADDDDDGDAAAVGGSGGSDFRDEDEEDDEGFQTGRSTARSAGESLLVSRSVPRSRRSVSRAASRGTRETSCAHSLLDEDEEDEVVEVETAASSRRGGGRRTSRRRR